MTRPENGFRGPQGEVKSKKNLLVNHLITSNYLLGQESSIIYIADPPCRITVRRVIKQGECQRGDRFQFDRKTSPLLSLIVVAKKAEQNQTKNTKQSQTRTNEVEPTLALFQEGDLPPAYQEMAHKSPLQIMTARGHEPSTTVCR